MPDQQPPWYIQIGKWFVDLEDRKATNLKWTLVAAGVGWAIYDKPEAFGPWLQKLLDMADLQTWALICMGLFTAFNLAAHVKRVEREFTWRLEEKDVQIQELRDLIAAMKIDHAEMIGEVSAQRDRCNREAAHYRTAITMLVLLAQKPDAGDDAKVVLDNLDRALQEEGLRGFHRAAKPGGNRDTDPPGNS